MSIYSFHVLETYRLCTEPLLHTYIYINLFFPRLQCLLHVSKIESRMGDTTHVVCVQADIKQHLFLPLCAFVGNLSTRTLSNGMWYTHMPQYDQNEEDSHVLIELRACHLCQSIDHYYLLLLLLLKIDGNDFMGW